MKARILIRLKVNYLQISIPCVASNLQGKPEYPKVNKRPKAIAGFSKLFFYPSGFI